MKVVVLLEGLLIALRKLNNFYNLYSWEIGFGVRYAKNRLNVKRKKLMQEIVCACAGKPLRDNSRSTRCGCMALIRLLRSDDKGCSSIFPNMCCRMWLRHGDPVLPIITGRIVRDEFVVQGALSYHSVDAVVRLFNEKESAMSGVRAAVRYVKNDTSRLVKFQECAELEKMRNHNLLLICLARKVLEYLALESQRSSIGKTQKS